MDAVLDELDRDGWAVNQATFAPVPCWRRRSARLDVVAVHPWTWLRRPEGEPLTSFSAWRRAAP